jgi:hypothetical protein
MNRGVGLWAGGEMVPASEKCVASGCAHRRRPGRKTCQVHADRMAQAYRTRKREKSAGLAPFLLDPSLLPKRPPGCR